MINVLIHGASGRMGRVVARLIAEECPDMAVVAGVSADVEENAAEGVFTDIEHNDRAVDCVVDFSHHTAAEHLMKYCVEHKLPVVVATTGHTVEEKQFIYSAAKEVPVFFSANMSIGIAFLAEIGKKAATLFPNADIEIVEKHHNQKLDVPSGTALMLANRIREARTDAELVVGRHENGKRRSEEIGIHSLRMGNEVGTHEIIVSTGSETLTLSHRAEDRRLFADGALAAIRFLLGRNAGLYDMRSMLEA